MHKYFSILFCLAKEKTSKVFDTNQIPQKSKSTYVVSINNLWKLKTFMKYLNTIRN